MSAKYDRNLKKPCGYIRETQKLQKNMDIKKTKKRVLDGIKPFIFDQLSSIYAIAVHKNHNA